jgi:sedoheptulokinase
MRSIALDIGTTKICALAVDEDDGAVLEILSADNAFLPSSFPWERIQDPEYTLGIAEELCSSLIKKHSPVRGIGVSGQMHGILYVNPEGKAVSPLYTWQDMCGAQPYRDGKRYADYLKQFSSAPLSAGYGLATHFYRCRAAAVPAGASGICTIGDYIAMSLCAVHTPCIHATNAAGLGFFDLSGLSFDLPAMESAGLDPSVLPRISGEYEVVGETRGGIPMCAAIGDNQASFLGSVRDTDSSILVNIGTGSQISLVTGRAEKAGGLEPRPFFEGTFLLVGASLAGGRAYAFLEAFFRGVLSMAGVSAGRPLYQAMDALTDQPPADPLEVNTMFAGSRRDASLRGWIKNISEDNFTPAALVRGFLDSMARELHDMFLLAPEKNAYQRLVGSGNGFRKNQPLRRIVSEKFNMPVSMTRYQEEAAYGAALFALIGTGRFSGISEARRMVQYQEDERRE